MARNTQHPQQTAERKLLDAQVSQARGGPTEGSGAVKQRLQELLHGLVSRPRIKHAIIAVESGDRSLRWIGAAGDANPNGTPMRADTPFFIASVTKLYIAAVIFKLHERSEIAIGDPMMKYLPQHLTRGLHRMDGVDYTDTITIRHLLGHASGLPDYLEDRPRGGKSLLNRLVEEGDRSWTIAEAMQIVRDTLTPHFPPQPLGAKRWKIRYSDTNYQLLIAIIEAVTGKPLHVAFEEMLYAPLKLKHTFHPGTLAAEPAREPATVWAEDQPLDLPLAMRSFGDLYSTADDTLAFMRALSRGEVFEDPATLELMMGNWNTFGFSLNPQSPTWPIEYGLGMMRFGIPRIFSPIRPIPAVVGHTGVTGSWLFYCPQLDMLLSGTVDQLTAAAVPFRFVPRLLRVLEPIAAKRAGVVP